MGRLFENVTMDIQAERRNTAQARAERDLARQERDSMQKELNFTQQERDSALRNLKIQKYIFRMITQHCLDEEIVASLTQHFNLTEEQATEKLKQAFED